MVADLPPQPPRQAPILYDADTGAQIGGRFARWANSFALPSGRSVKIRFAPNPALVSQEPASIMYGASPEEDTIFFDKAALGAFPRSTWRQTLVHELSHHYDYRYATEPTRQRFLQIMHDIRPWRSASESPHEQFAEALSNYMVNKGRVRHGGYGFRPNRGQRRALNRLFDSLGNPQA